MLCFVLFIFFFFKQKTAYEMRISDWSSDVCSSDLQVLLWMGTGALMSFLDLEEVRSEQVVSREQEALPADAPLPAWVANDGTLAAVTTRSLDDDAVTEVRKVNGKIGRANV